MATELDPRRQGVRRAVRVWGSTRAARPPTPGEAAFLRLAHETEEQP